MKASEGMVIRAQDVQHGGSECHRHTAMNVKHLFCFIRSINSDNDHDSSQELVGDM